jgi:hypothetical protein
MRTMLTIASTAMVFACTDGFTSQTDEAETVGSAAQSAIYQNDDRCEVYQYPNEAIRTFAASSTVALVFAHRLNQAPNGRFVYDTTTLGDAKSLCPGERFEEQPAVADCSGTLIDDDLVLTAGHCLGSNAADADRLCRSLVAVFGFAYTSDGLPSPPSDDIRLCKTVVAREYVEGDATAGDFAVIQLDRPASAQRQPAQIAMRPVIALEPVVLIGNGGGLPTKVDDGGWVLEAQTHPEFFRANTDGFVGGSGSSLIDADLKLLGIQSRGGPDFGFTGQCNRLIKSSSGTELHQKASRAIEALCAAQWPSNRLCQLEPRCGDAVCSPTETPESCAADCPRPSCGDGNCDVDEWENCVADCGWIRRVPSNWWCPPHFYADGTTCHCECGAVDPDCSISSSITEQGCSWGRRCGASGRCELAGNAPAVTNTSPVASSNNRPNCSISDRRIGSASREPFWLLVVLSIGSLRRFGRKTGRGL